MIRLESSSETAARFIALRRGRPRPIRKRQSAQPAPRPSLGLATTALASAVRTSNVMVLVERAAWTPDARVSRLLATSPIAPIIWPTMPFESNADRLRRYRLAAVAKGRCYSCRARPVRPGTRYCEDCFDRVNKHQKAIAYKRCQSCYADVRGRKALLCAACTTRSSATARIWADRKTAKGLCDRCGNRPLLTGHRGCVDCLDDKRERALATMREAGRKARPCPICRELGINGTGHNRRTHDRWMERRKAWAP